MWLYLGLTFINKCECAPVSYLQAERSAESEVVAHKQQVQLTNREKELDSLSPFGLQCFPYRWAVAAGAVSDTAPVTESDTRSLPGSSVSPPRLGPGAFSSGLEGWAVVSAARAAAACGMFCMLPGKAGGRKGSVARPLQGNFEGLGIESSLSLVSLVCGLGIIRKCSF